jgi:hypothetical protein
MAKKLARRRRMPTDRVINFIWISSTCSLIKLIASARKKRNVCLEEALRLLRVGGGLL